MSFLKSFKYDWDKFLQELLTLCENYKGSITYNDFMAMDLNEFVDIYKNTIINIEKRNK